MVEFHRGDIIGTDVWKKGTDFVREVERDILARYGALLEYIDASASLCFQYPLYRRLGGPQSRSGHRLEEISAASTGDRTPVVQSVVRHCTD
jgi:hypothetical protein